MAWARPLTMVFIVIILITSVLHFAWQHGRRGGWRQYTGAGAVRVSSAAGTWLVGPDALLLFRGCVFVTSLWTLLHSSWYAGPTCLRFFTVWNFAALVVFFALGTALSCSCCRDVALLRPTPSRAHRIAAAVHHLLLEVEL